MLALAAIGAVALIGAIVAGVTWRRGVDERQSVKHYHSTLETLRHVSDRVEPQARSASGRSARKGSTGASAVTGSVSPARTTSAKGRTSAQLAPDKVVEGLVRSRGSPPSAGHGAPPATEPAGTARRRVEPTGADDAVAAAGNGRGQDAVGDEGRPGLVFDDGAPPGAFTPDPGSRRAIQRMRTKRPVSAGSRLLRGVLVGVGVVVVAGLVAGVVLALTPSHATHTVRGLPRATPPTASHATTTLPAVVQPTTSTTSSATYASPAGSYTVVLDATGLCWVLASDVATGRVLWTGTMSAGQSQSLAGTGTIRVTLGAASDVNMTLQGQPVVLPAAYHSPFIATFAPPGSAGT